MDKLNFTSNSSGNATINGTTGDVNWFPNSGTSTFLNTWSNPELKETREVGESIEMIYEEVSLISYTWSIYYPN